MVVIHIKNIGDIPSKSAFTGGSMTPMSSHMIYVAPLACRYVSHVCNEGSRAISVENKLAVLKICSLQDPQKTAKKKKKKTEKKCQVWAPQKGRFGEGQDVWT